MNLMESLAERLGISYLYITHDLAVARYMCSRIAVMYLGKIVEMGDTEAVLQNPQHPYMLALLSAVPIPDPAATRAPVRISGGVARPLNLPPRCRFYSRCPIAGRLLPGQSASGVGGEGRSASGSLLEVVGSGSSEPAPRRATLDPACESNAIHKPLTKGGGPMPDSVPSSPTLRLPSLVIKGFRGIDELSIPRLGRVTLFTGKNGVGKTSLLDAVRVYAARGRSSVLTQILQDREELTRTFDEDGDERLTPDWDALFYGRDTSPDASISMGWRDENSHELTIENSEFGEKEYEQWGSYIPEYFQDEDLRVIRTRLYDKELTIPFFMTNSPINSLRRRRLVAGDSSFPPAIKCTSLGPGLISNSSMGDFWRSVALTDDADRAVQALRLIFGDIVRDVAVISDDRYSRYGSRAIVSVRGQDSPVPLKSLGDGAVRMFGVALALANTRGGFLVIDEAENGIHHSVQRDFWTMVLQTAYENDVQVFATTHGWNCVSGFAQAASNVAEVDGALIRIERTEERVRAVTYSEDELEVAAPTGH